MILELILAGLAALKEYIALHVLTCLIPAFLLAGAMVRFISKEAVIRYLGSGVSKIKSFSLASVSGFFVAVCSCTVIPVAGGIYCQGAGIGPAFILLWVAPAANILSIIYTGKILGAEMVVSRIVSALFLAMVVGTVMSFVFGKKDEARVHPPGPEAPKIIAAKDLILLALILASLLAPNYLGQKGRYLYNVMIWAAVSAAMFLYAFKMKTKEEIKEWLTESWWFMKMIFPLLLAGVFIVGVIGRLIPEPLIRNWVGGSGLSASFLAAFLGQIMYFATMTEAPFTDTMMKLGMGKGPALALLLTGPGMSLPNMLAIAKVFGIKKAAVYMLLILTLGTLTGWFFGNFIF